MRVLISGAGIAGTTLAFWLNQYGVEVTIIESAPRFRTGGYLIDFWGAGFEVAERMGLVPQLKEKGYLMREVRIVDGRGRRVTGFPAEVFGRVTQGRYVSLPRGDLAGLIFGTIERKVETLFGDSVAAIEQTPVGVLVRFQHAPARTFDVVVGADGLHSRVRELVFGPQSRFEHYLGLKVAAFEAPGYRPRDELVYVMYTEVGQQVGRFALRGDRTMFLFTFADAGAGDVAEDDPAAQRALLHKRFGASGWECSPILAALDSCPEFYFDRVSQIRMMSREGLWTRGRVTLVGDAAFCVSLLAGQGSALAMVAAYILAGELHRAAGNHDTAFARYQERFAPFVGRKQKAALRFSGFFAPPSRLALALRNRIVGLSSIPWIANLAFGADLIDRLELPAY